ncbi:MAG: hypothetical protein FWD97_05050 [Defluviitaleaceae bacterium]|nr:hypothetical protein [Defluviitaleaceae bacterium]
MTKDKTKIHVRPKTELMTHGSSALALAPAIAPVYVPHVSPSTVSSISNTTHATQEPIIFDSNWVKAQEERNYARDDAEKFFSNAPAMLEFLGEREAGASWIVNVDIKALRLLLLEDANLVQSSATQEVLFDTRENTGLCIEGKGLAQTALRSCAITSLSARARISGAALGDVSKPVFRNILNECLKVASKKSTAKIRMAEGKVSAVLSSSYVPLSMPEIFEMATEYVDQRFPNNHFVGGNWSHSITSAEWELTGEGGLIKAYKEALTKHGLTDSQAHKNIQPGLRLSSSDIGISGVNLMPKLVVGNDRLLLPLGGPMGLEHKGGASMENFRENLEGVFAQYSDQLEKLASLLDIAIENPVNCLKEVMKRLGVPKKYATPVLEIFGISFGNGSHCTAHDIYYGLGELMMQLQIQKATGEQALRMEETIAKALSLNFEEYDIPGEDG